MENETPNLDELRELSNRLSNLLNDPHPGLTMWVKALARVIADIAAFGGY